MSRSMALFLALCIALTSQAFALARGHAAAAGEMVICTGAGFVTVAVDAEGKPVGPVHICPDAVVALAGLATAPVGAVLRLREARAEVAGGAVVALPSWRVGVKQARGPPQAA
jgi:hypothetical protein